MNEDFLLSVVNRYECQLSSGGVIEKYSLEGNVTAANASTTKSLKELTVFIAVPDKNITTEVKFEDLTPGSSREKELISVKLNPRENPPPVIVTETISSGEKSEEDFRVVYPQRDNTIFDRLTVKNQGTVVVPKIRLIKNVETFSNFLQNQIRVDSGNIAMEKNALIWDIDDLKPDQSVTLTFTANIVVGSMEPPMNPWTSLVYEMPAKKENIRLWNIKKIEIPNPIKVEQRVFKKIQSEITDNQWECQVALKNITDWDLLFKKITVTQGNNKIPVFEQSLEKGLLLSANQAWQSDLWLLKQDIEPSLIVTIESDFLPKTAAQVLYDLAIPESPFERAKITASRTIRLVEVDSPDTIRVLFESVLKNSGTASLNDIEIIHQFPKYVELPNASEVSLTLRGTQVSNSNFEVNQTPNGEIPDCILFRILIQNLIASLGGLKGGEEIRLTFPVFLKVNLASGVLKFPTLFNALVRPNTPLLEDTAADTSLANVQVKRRSEVPAIKPAVAEKSFEAEVIRKFSTLAVESYNARKFDDALAYCEQILSVAQKIEDKAMIQKFSNILTKIQRIIQRNVQEKGKGTSNSPRK